MDSTPSDLNLIIFFARIACEFLTREKCVCMAQLPAPGSTRSTTSSRPPSRAPVRRHEALPRLPQVTRQDTAPSSKQHRAIRDTACRLFTHEPENGTFPIICVNGGLIFEHKLLWPALSALAARRRVIHGLADVLTFEMEQETVRRLGPAATLLPVPAAGHNAFLEQPSVVFPAIEAFLTAAERTTTL